MSDIMHQTAVHLAQQTAMAREGAKTLSHGCRLFPVESGWESDVIKNDDGVRVCGTLLLLEEAVQDEEARVIFIPADALMQDADIERVCRRNGAVKTLFREVGKS